MSIFKHKTDEVVIEPPSLGSYPDFTKKEIYTQGRIIADFITNYVKSGKIQFDYLKIKSDRIKRVYIVGSGVNYSSAIFGAYNFEFLLDVVSVPVLSGEFVYSNPILDKSTLVILLGEDRRVEQRVEQTQAKIIRILEGGDRKRDIVLNYKELGEFPTVSYTLMLVALALLSLYLGEKNQIINKTYVRTVLDGLYDLDAKIKGVISKEFLINEIAKHLDYDNMLIVGTNVDYSIAIYGSKILSCAVKDKIDCSTLEEAIDYQKPMSLVALASNMDFYSLLDNDLTYQLKITSGAVKVIDEKTIFYNESLPIFNPILSAVMLQMIAYKACQTK